jgi:hypothetical protein
VDGLWLAVEVSAAEAPAAAEELRRLGALQVETAVEAGR